MSGFLALARAVMRSSWRYWVGFVFGTFGMVFQLIALLAIWRVLLADGPLGGFTQQDMQAYLLVAFTCGMVVSSFADYQMAYRIESGMVSLDIVKPIDYQLARFAETVGGLVLEMLVAAAAWVAVALIGGGLRLPRPELVLLFVLSMVLVVPLKFLITYMCSLTCFWTQHYTGVRWAQLAIVGILSGSMIPIALFPDWLASIVAWLPFAGVASTPGLIYVGRIDLAEATSLLAIQAGWAVVLWFAAKGAFRVASRQLTVHGG